MRRVSVPVALTLLGFASGAYAHPKLVSATPAPNATVTKPGRVELHFSEKLMPKFTGADLMTGGAVKVASVATVGADGCTLVITPKSPLGAGRYSVAWHAVSVDTHRVTGNYAFAVK